MVVELIFDFYLKSEIIEIKTNFKFSVNYYLFRAFYLKKQCHEVKNISIRILHNYSMVDYK